MKGVVTMTSPSMQKKIENARRNAKYELPMARVCAKVIWACTQDAEALQAALMELKEVCGLNWSHVTAFQFMSGMRGEFASDSAPQEEQPQLYAACLLAKAVCHGLMLGGSSAPENIDFAKFRALAEAAWKGQG